MVNEIDLYKTYASTYILATLSLHHIGWTLTCPHFEISESTTLSNGVGKKLSPNFTESGGQADPIHYTQF